MRGLLTEIEINRKSSEIWNVLTDLKSYPDWNPLIVRAEGCTSEGDALKITIKTPERKNLILKPLVLKSRKNIELRWREVLMGNSTFFSGEHYFILEPLTRNKTRLVHGETF
jgi:hypothetical protein